MDKLKTPILQSHFMSNEKKSEMSARGSVNRIDSKVQVKFYLILWFLAESTEEYRNFGEEGKYNFCSKLEPSARSWSGY